jgi:hypothetical protein
MAGEIHPNNRKDFLPFLFFFLGVATRVPFTSRFLLHLDSGHFALALEKFDITVHQPHPPGYFLYVMMGRILHLFIADANAVFVVISVFFSGLTVACVYLLGKEVFDRKTGIAAAMLALSSPSMWFHGEVALCYIVEAYFSTVVALYCWRLLQGQEKYLWISVVALGVAGGIRQNTTVFLFPLWLYSVRNLPPRKIVASVFLLAGTCLSWFVPMVWMSGGWGPYRGALQELWMFHTGGHGLLTGSWGWLIIFSWRMVQFIVFGLGVVLYPLALAVYSIARREQRRSLDSTKVSFFAVWVLPAIMFFLFVFLSPQNPGYVLILLPAFLLLASFSIVHVGNNLGKWCDGRAWLPILVVVVVLNSAAFFLLKASVPVTHRWIRTHDRDLSALLNDINTFAPGDTAVFVNNLLYYSYRHIMYYLPEYRVYNVDVRVAPTGEERKTFQGFQRKTVLTDGFPIPDNIRFFVTPLDSGDSMYYEKDAYEKEGLVVRDLSPNLRIATGPISLLRKVFPNVRVRP